MKIRNVTINSFGKLQNYSLDLNNGINVIYGENEYGKSTVMAFIKLMFYGKLKSGGAGDENLRKKYTPWNGLKMSGSITIEHKGKIYKVQKEISSRSASYDKTTIYNLSEGNTIKLGKDEEVGEHFLGIDATGFERSSYIKNIGDIDFKIKKSKTVSKDSVLDKMLSNLASGGEEDVSQSEVVSGVKRALNNLRTEKGKGGAITKLEKDIESLESKINGIKEFERAQEEEKGKLKNLERLIDEQKKIALEIEKADKYKRTREIEDVKGLVLARDKLKEKAAERGINLDSCEEVSQTLEEYNNKLHDVELNVKQCKDMSKSKEDFIKITQEEEDFFREQTRICNESVNNSKGSAETQSEIDRLRNLKVKKSEQADNIKKKSASKLKSCMISGFVLLAFSIAAIVYNFLVPSLVLLGGFLGSVIVYLISKSKLDGEREALLKEIKEIDDKIENLAYESTKLIGTYGEEYETASEKIKHLLSEKKCKDYNDFYQNRALSKEQERYENILVELGSKREEIIGMLRVYLSSNGIDIDLNNLDEYLKILHDYEEKYKELDRQINYKSRVLGLKKLDKISLENLLSSFSFDKDSVIDKDAVEALRIRFEELKSMNLYDRYKEISARIVKQPEDLESLQINLSKLNAKRKRMLYYYDCLNIAKETLEEAIAEMRSSFNPKLNSRASEIFKALTGGKYSYMRVGKDYKFVVGDEGIDRESSCFSCGTTDQAYLALRIAISELISAERVPFLFDDTLMQYDDKRLDEAIKFLREYVAESNAQVIIFTCHKAVSEKISL